MNNRKRWWQNTKKWDCRSRMFETGILGIKNNQTTQWNRSIMSSLSSSSSLDEPSDPYISSILPTHSLAFMWNILLYLFSFVCLAALFCIWSFCHFCCFSWFLCHCFVHDGLHTVHFAAKNWPNGCSCYFKTKESDCHKPHRVVSHITPVTLPWHILDPFWVILWKSLSWLPPTCI